MLVDLHERPLQIASKDLEDLRALVETFLDGARRELPHRMRFETRLDRLVEQLENAGNLVVLHELFPRACCHEAHGMRRTSARERCAGKRLLKNAERLPSLTPTLDHRFESIAELGRIILQHEQRLPVIRSVVADVEMFLDELHSSVHVVSGKVGDLHQEEGRMMPSSTDVNELHNVTQRGLWGLKVHRQALFVPLCLKIRLTTFEAF
jgi:hypothetical protein